MFEVRFIHRDKSTGKVDISFVDRGFATLQAALQHVTYSLPAHSMDQILVVEDNGRVRADIQP